MGRGEPFLGNMGLETLALATFSSFQVYKFKNLEIEKYENRDILRKNRSVIRSVITLN